MRITRRRSLGLLAALGAMPIHAVAQEKPKQKPSYYEAIDALTFTAGNDRLGRLLVLCNSKEQGDKTLLNKVTARIDLNPGFVLFKAPTRIQFEVTERADSRGKDVRRKLTQAISGIKFNGDKEIDQAGIEITIESTIQKDGSYQLKKQAMLKGHFDMVDSSGNDVFLDLITVPPQNKLRVDIGTMTGLGSGVGAVPANRVYRTYIFGDRYKREEQYFQSNITITPELLRDSEPMALVCKLDGGKELNFASMSVGACKMAYDSIDKLVQQNVAKLRASKGEPKYSSGCILSTIVVNGLGLPDDAWELRTLRRFRDEYMQATGLGDEVQRYYRLSKRVLGSARMQTDRLAGELRGLYWSMVLPCALLSRVGLNRACYGLYRTQVGRLLKRCRRSH